MTDQEFTNELSAEAELVRRYFHEVLDQGKVELIKDLFHPQCVMHRPGGTIMGIDSIHDIAKQRKKTFSQFETQIHDIFGSGNQLVIQLSHHSVRNGV